MDGDIVAKLRADDLWQQDELEYLQPLCREAAATIEALRAELAGRDAEIAGWLRKGAKGIRKDSADGLWDDEDEAELTADDWEFLATAIASGAYRETGSD